MSLNKDKFADMMKDMLSCCGSGYNGMSIATMKSFLPRITELLDCGKNTKWRKVCFDMDNQNAQSYLNLPPKELLKYNGMSLKDWKEEDITRKDVLVALDSAWHKLTPTAVRMNKKIRKHLTNKDILNLASEQLYYVHDYHHKCYDLPNPYWLECLNPKDKMPFLPNFKSWIDYLNIVYWFVPREEYKHFADKLSLLKKLKAPETVVNYASQLCSFALRYTAENPERDYSKKKYVLLSADINENEEFEVYLKMKGINWHKEWSNRLEHEQHYQDNLFALNECLIAKYDKQEKENTI